MRTEIKIVNGFMEKSDASLISEYANKNDKLFAEFGNGEKEFKFNPDIQDSDILDLINFYGMKVQQFVESNYLGKFTEYDKTKTHIARFEKGWGMHEHFDSSRPNDIATLIYINNDYNGGEIYFPEYDICLKPEPGDLVCFPDTPNFIHGVKPISEGIRYTIPRWITRIV